jgi:hypothetical protein
MVDLKESRGYSHLKEEGILLETKCVYGRRSRNVFSNCGRNQLHVSALL